jgi:ketosteroid isomerase-like protein
MTDAAAANDADVVRIAFERFNARDAEGLVALMEPDGEIFPYAIDERRQDGYKGHDGVRQYVADVNALFAEFSVEITDYRDLGDGDVLADGRLRGRTRDGSAIDMAASWLWTLRDGRVVRMQAHPAPGAQRDQRD